MVYKHGKHEIEIFDSVHTTGMLRFQKLNKYRIQQSEVGSTFQDFDLRIAKVLEFIAKGLTEKAIKEAKNLRLTVFNAMNEFSPHSKAFAVMVKRIDDVEYKDFTPEGLDKVLLHLEKIEFDFAKSVEKLTEVKKK